MFYISIKYWFKLILILYSKLGFDDNYPFLNSSIQNNTLTTSNQLIINGFGFCNDYCNDNQVIISQIPSSSAFCSNIIYCSLNQLICEINGTFNEGPIYSQVIINPFLGCGIVGNTSLTQIGNAYG